MARYVLEVSDKFGNIGYFRNQITSSKILEGMKMEYKEYVLTEDIEKASTAFDASGFHEILSIMKESRPLWFEEHNFKVVRKPTLRDAVIINTRPLKTLTRLVKGYKAATGNIDAKAKLIDKITSDELLSACEYSLTQLDKLK